jgi:putative membrane protein
LLVSFLAVLVWSGIRPRDRLTWVLEVLPAVSAMIVLLATYRRFRFTPLAYFLIWLHAIVLVVGGKYTYAEMPLFNWLRDEFGWARNHYDRVGHFMQGFVPAIVAREVLLRTSPLRRGKWLFVIVIMICVGLSAVFELCEFGVALIYGAAADSYLAFQGDPWDTQKDMGLCLLGAFLAWLLLSRWHDRQLQDAEALRCGEIRI